MNLDPELEIYLRDAWRYNEEHYEQPAYGQPFRSPLFEFVRTVRAHPSLPATFSGTSRAPSCCHVANSRKPLAVSL